MKSITSKSLSSSNRDLRKQVFIHHEHNLDYIKQAGIEALLGDVKNKKHEISDMIKAKPQNLFTTFIKRLTEKVDDEGEKLQ